MPRKRGAPMDEVHRALRRRADRPVCRRSRSRVSAACCGNEQRHGENYERSEQSRHGCVAASVPVRNPLRKMHPPAPARIALKGITDTKQEGRSRP